MRILHCWMDVLLQVILSIIFFYKKKTINKQPRLHFLNVVDMYYFNACKLFFRDDPGEHFMITRDEVDMIHRGKTKDHLMSVSALPYFHRCSIFYNNCQANIVYKNICYI